MLRNPSKQLFHYLIEGRSQKLNVKLSEAQRKETSGAIKMWVLPKLFTLKRSGSSMKGFCQWSYMEQKQGQGGCWSETVSVIWK